MSSDQKSKHAINNRFSFNDQFWAWFSLHLISFSFAGMQKDVHFSVSFNKNSSDLNLHLTRNTNNPENKPKIEVARISKKDLSVISGYLPDILFKRLLTPICFKRFGRRKNNYHYGTSYLPLDNLEENVIGSLVQKELEQLILIRKKRLKLHSNFESHLTTAFKERNVGDQILGKIKWLPVKLQHKNMSAFIISNQFTGCALYISGKWYALRQDINLKELFCDVMPKHLSESLYFKILMAYTRICNCSTQEDSTPYNNPYSLQLIN